MSTVRQIHASALLHSAKRQQENRREHQQQQQHVVVEDLEGPHRLRREGSGVAQDRRRIPGLSAGAAFFQSLSANLRLVDDDFSNMSASDTPSPALLPAAENSQSASNNSDTGADPLAGIPELITHPTASSAETILALKLITDSIAQQRQVAAWAVISNPLSLAIWLGLLAVIGQLLYKSSDDLALLATTFSGVAMTWLVAVRMLVAPYLERAESFKWDWLVDENGKEDLVLTTVYGDEVIGAIVVRLVEGQKAKGKGSRKGSGAKKARAVIRGWAVRMRFRGKGVGGHLLEEGVRITRERLGDDRVEVVFAEDHAHSLRVLPNFFNGVFNRREARAVKALKKVLEGHPLSS